MLLFVFRKTTNMIFKKISAAALVVFANAMLEKFAE